MVEDIYKKYPVLNQLFLAMDNNDSLAVEKLGKKLKADLLRPLLEALGYNENVISLDAMRLIKGNRDSE